MNCMKKKSNKQAIYFYQPDPTPRIVVTNLNGTKWRGWIYLSLYDHTGQVKQYLTGKSKDIPLGLSKIPFWIFVLKDKSEIETRISETLQLIRRKERLLTINLN